MNNEQETEAFEEAWKAAHEAEQRTSLLSAELVRHVESLQNCNIARTSEMQATLSLEMIESAIDELKKANDALLKILLRSGE